MPLIPRTQPKFVPQRVVEIDRNDFSGGWNNYYKSTEIKENEMVSAENLMLIGKGIPTGRWGSETYSLMGSGNVRLIDSFKLPNSNTNELLAITDLGLLTKKSGASYAVITGASYASGVKSESSQLGNYMYFVSEGTPLSRYDGANLYVYATLSTPSITGISLISGATGLTSWSWKVEALSNTGETPPSSPAIYASLPVDLTNTTIRLTWSPVSAASGGLRGYAIYRGLPGDETLIDSVGPTTTTYIDQGTPQSDTIYPSNSNTTGGVKAKFIRRFDDRVVIAGIENDPTLVLISGKYPNQDKFYWADGGGYIRVAPDSGDEITGIDIAGSQAQGAQIPSSILVFMKNSTHQIVLRTVTIGNYLILDPLAQQITPTGCSNYKTIVPIDNNTFYFGRLGLYTVGSEAAYLNQIRTREISARIRPYIQNLTESDFDEACAGYMDYKYLLSFPSKKDTIVYDYERACFMGPWKTPWGITSWYRHIASDGEKYLAGTTSGTVKEFSDGYLTDSGTAISKIARFRKEDFTDWSIMKVIRTFYVLFRSVRGSVSLNISLEERNGTVVTAKSFNITGSSGNTGWGTSDWGGLGWGDTQNIVTVSTDEIIRWTNLYKTARIIQVEVLSTGASDNWEFLGYKANAQPQSEGSLSSTYRV